MQICQYHNKKLCIFAWSLPSRERGLKFLYIAQSWTLRAGRSLRGSVDWNNQEPMRIFRKLRGRSLRGSVDWNNYFIKPVVRWFCGRSLRGSVDWNTMTKTKLYAGNVVAPFAGAWIEISRSLIWFQGRFLVAPFAGAWIEILHSSQLSWLSHGRSLRGSVDWNFYCCRSTVARVSGRSLRGSVDWNSLFAPFTILCKWSLPSRERGLKLQ